MPALRDPGRPVLVCPECSSTHGGHARIGNRKKTCPLCNRFAQAVRRAVAADLTALHPQDAERLRVDAEARVYRRVAKP